MMLNSFDKWLAVTVVSLLSIQSYADIDTNNATESESVRLEKERIREDTSAIRTRDDLIRYLANTSPTNPLNLLSAEARSRLLDTLVVNENGEIASLYTADIRTELTPSEAYRVFPFSDILRQQAFTTTAKKVRSWTKQSLNENRPRR